MGKTKEKEKKKRDETDDIKMNHQGGTISEGEWITKKSPMFSHSPPSDSKSHKSDKLKVKSHQSSPTSPSITKKTPSHRPTSVMKPGSNVGYPTAISGKRFTVTLIGAMGEVGRMLALLLKINPLIKRLNLFDIFDPEGLLEDLDTLNTGPTVQAYGGNDFNQMKESLVNADIVLVASGVPLKPDVSDEQKLKANLRMIKNIVTGVAEVCPRAFVAIGAEPINSTTALAVELMNRHHIKDGEKRVFGVTTMDVVRACTFTSEKMGLSSNKITVPVIGGHSKRTTLPVLSQASVQVKLTVEERETIMYQVREAPNAVAKAKGGRGGSTTCITYAIYHFVCSLLMALNGKNMVECAFVRSDIRGCRFFASPVLIDKHGVDTVYGPGDLDQFEEEQLKKVIIALKYDIQKGEDFARDD